MKANNLEQAKRKLEDKGINYPNIENELPDNALNYNHYLLIDSITMVIDGQQEVEKNVKKYVKHPLNIERNRSIKDIVSKSNCILFHDVIKYEKDQGAKALKKKKETKKDK